MPIKIALKKSILTCLLVATAVLAQSPYDEGQQALRDQRWTDAADQFDVVIQTGEEQVDAALYWKAYALYKAGRKNEAERELRKLERAYPQSRWTRESQALRVEYPDSTESIERVAANDSLMDDELRLFALSQLMERDPERAMPLVLEMLNNSSSRQVRNDALFLLGMSDHPAAGRALAEAARNSEDPEMQMDAIHMLGTLDASDELQSLYPDLKSIEARVTLIEALSIQGQTAILIGYLESETDPEVRKAAINGLAMEGDAESMAFIESMYDSSPNQEEKIAILESLMLMDDAEALALKILRTESDPELQRRAIEALGVMDATAALGELYANVTDENTRADVIEALVIADDAAGITNVLRVEKDPVLRAQAIQALAIIDDELASGYVLELYPDGTREEKEAIIESMMIAENTQGLFSLLEQENDPELKRQMLQMLTIIDSEESNEYLFRMLEKKD